MTMTMAKECAPRGVTVNAVAPVRRDPSHKNMKRRLSPAQFGGRSLRVLARQGFIESDMTAELPADIIDGVMKGIPCGG